MPNSPPTLVVLEFDDFTVKSEEDLIREVRSEEEIDVLLRANDEDENLSHLVLRDRHGDEIDRLECLDSELSQCEALLKITASERADWTEEFSAVAVDRRQEESVPIFMTIITKKKRVGGGGGGGSSSSQPTPTPVPFPVVSLEKGQTSVGGTVELTLKIDKVPNGLSGYEVKISVADPTVATITGVTFPPEFHEDYSHKLLSPPFSEVQLIVVDIFQEIQPGDTNVVLAFITFEGLKQGVTSIAVSDDTDKGIQDESATIMRVTITSGELTVQ
ncbi:MAG: hypothetical protein IH861_11710 [Chloroflexi bacterium]|nr:hypothetical protein [Chloroflexota bacterium]